MKKKYALGAAALVLVMGALFGFSQLMDWGQLAVDEVRDSAQSLVSIDSEIRQLEREAERLVPAIDDAQKDVVEQEVVVEDAAEEVKTLAASVKQQWSEIVALKEAYTGTKDGEQFVSIGGKDHTKAEVLSDLERRMTAHNGAEASLANLEESLQAQQANLDARRQYLENLYTLQSDLKTEINQLKSRHELVKAKKVEVSDEVDDSRIDAIKERLKKVENRVRVEEKLLEKDGAGHGRIDVQGESDRNILEEIETRQQQKALDSDSELINKIK